ncbi:glycosyltransferase family 2 protein [Kallotenue papyrolyticum]|uniref:glycosyltransferase family 2 protein n=1 Tax=Kallotenue papyrolyticum TaxID=1325125 RepID=UPI0004786568|nr:glycosyltransferase family 2 protein [Kallotenue papyrolyticum]
MACDLSIVVPVHRNAATLRELHARLSRAAQHSGADYELIFVDDACPQHSLTVLRELAARDARVAVLALAENVGQNTAVLAGLELARGAVAVVLDADLQDPPEAIPRLVQAARTGAIVFGGRRGRYESWPRQISSWLFKHALAWRSGGRLPPDAGLFVALPRPAIDRLLALPVAQPYVVGMLTRTGLPLRSIPVQRAAAPERRSSYSNRQRLRLAWHGLRSLQSEPASGDWRDRVRVRERLGQRFTDGCARSSGTLPAGSPTGVRA